MTLEEIDEQIHICNLCEGIVEKFPNSKTVSKGRKKDMSNSRVAVVKNISNVVENSSQSQVNKGKTRVFFFSKKCPK